MRRVFHSPAPQSDLLLDEVQVERGEVEGEEEMNQLIIVQILCGVTAVLFGLTLLIFGDTARLSAWAIFFGGFILFLNGMKYK